MKKLLHTLLVAALVVICAAILPTEVQAATVDSGACGDNLTWALDDAGILTISGTGEMYNNFKWNGNKDSIKVVVIKDGATSIGSNAFYWCNSLIGVTIPDSVTSIGTDAFNKCENLTSVTMGNGVTSIGDNTFYRCTSLTGITLPDSLISIGTEAFYYCGSLTSVIIPDGVTSISTRAFSGCIALKSVSFSENITNIGIGAFADCKSLSNVTIPDSVTNIENQAFYYCRNLTSVTIGNGVTNIGEEAFYCCDSLTSIMIGNSVESIGDQAFSSCGSLVSISIPDSVTSIGAGAFSSCSGLTSIIIPDSVTNVGDSAFYFCENLTDVKIGNGVTGIGSYTFWHCENLTGVVLGNSIRSIGYQAFFCCDNLTNIIIPDGVISIGGKAFAGCEKLSGIVVPESLLIVDYSAFSSCENLSTVFYRSTKSKKNNISFGSGNENISDAKWHYETEVLHLGTQPICYCKECELYYSPDGTGDVFADISNTSWQISHAVYACQKGLMAGKGTDANGKIKFDPNNSITREEFVQVLYNAEGKPSVSSTKVFPDVAAGGWYTNAVMWANEKGIASGMGNGNFGVGKNITRQDLALMLMKYAKLRGYSLAAEAGKINQFADGNKVAGYAKTAMDWAVTNGILSGKGESGKPLSTFKLDPTGTATRAECAAMLKNFMTAFEL